MELTTRTDTRRHLRHDPRSAFRQAHLKPPKAPGKAHLPPPFHFTDSHRCPSSQKSHQSPNYGYTQKAISSADLAPTPKLQLAPISIKS